jgi:transcriptional regulator NrdR family protein
MLCPICYNESIATARTIQQPWGVRRLRKCGRCGHDWATAEMPETEIVRLRKLEAAARGMTELLPERA